MDVFLGYQFGSGGSSALLRDFLNCALLRCRGGIPSQNKAVSLEGVARVDMRFSALVRPQRRDDLRRLCFFCRVFSGAVILGHAPRSLGCRPLSSGGSRAYLEQLNSLSGLTRGRIRRIGLSTDGVLRLARPGAALCERR